MNLSPKILEPPEIECSELFCQYDFEGILCSCQWLSKRYCFCMYFEENLISASVEIFDYHYRCIPCTTLEKHLELVEKEKQK